MTCIDIIYNDIVHVLKHFTINMTMVITIGKTQTHVQ